MVRAPTTDSLGNDLRWAAGAEAIRGWRKKAGAGWEENVPARVAAAEPRLRTKEPDSKYAEESKKVGAWRDKTASQSLKDRDILTTRYEEDPKDTAAAVTDGKLDLLDATHGFVQNERGGFHVFDPHRVDVLAPGDHYWQTGDDRFVKDYLRTKYKVKRTHHTTPLAGAAVASAGMLTTVGKKVKQISDESGHYTPEAEYMHQAVSRLHGEGAFLGEAGNYAHQVKFGAYSKGVGQGKDWIAKNPAFAQGEVELPAEAFLESRGNERQIRLKKKIDNASLEERKENLKEIGRPPRDFPRRA